MTPQERELILEKEASLCPMAPPSRIPSPWSGDPPWVCPKASPAENSRVISAAPPPSPPAFPGLWVCPGSTFRGFLPLNSTGHRHPPPCDTCRPRTPLRSCATAAASTRALARESKSPQCPAGRRLHRGPPPASSHTVPSLLLHPLGWAVSGRGPGASLRLGAGGGGGGWGGRTEGTRRT